MRISPGGAIIGVSVGTGVAAAAVITSLWSDLGAWYGSDYMLSIDPPLWLIAVTFFLFGSGAALLTGVVLVPVMRRWPRLQRFPGNVVMTVASVAAAALAFVFSGELPDARSYVVVVLAGSGVAIVVGVVATRVATRRAAAEAAALKRAFADDRD